MDFDPFVPLPPLPPLPPGYTRPDYPDDSGLRRQLDSLAQLIDKGKRLKVLNHDYLKQLHQELEQADKLVRYFTLEATSAYRTRVMPPGGFNFGPPPPRQPPPPRHLRARI